MVATDEESAGEEALGGNAKGIITDCNNFCLPNHFEILFFGIYKGNKEAFIQGQMRQHSSGAHTEWI